MSKERIKWGQLHIEYECACNNYVRAFCSLTGLEFDHWPGNDVGTVAAMGDYFFEMSDIRFAVDEKIPLKVLDEWYWASVGSADYHITLRMWMDGKRPKRIEP